MKWGFELLVVSPLACGSPYVDGIFTDDVDGDFQEHGVDQDHSIRICNLGRPRNWYGGFCDVYTKKPQQRSVVISMTCNKVLTFNWVFIKFVRKDDKC